MRHPERWPESNFAGPNLKLSSIRLSATAQKTMKNNSATILAKKPLPPHLTLCALR